jgi:integrase
VDTPTTSDLVKKTLRGIKRRIGTAPEQAPSATADIVERVIASIRTDTRADLRDRALILLGFAGAFRRSELVGIDVEHLRVRAEALELLIPRSKGDPDGEGQRISIGRGKGRDTCPVRALEAWLRAAGIRFGPVFRRVTRHGTVEPARLSAEAVRLVLRKRAALAGIKGTELEPVTPHGLRAGFVTQSSLAGARDEEVMEHTRHRHLATMRRYVRRAKLTKGEATAKLGL